jgi:YbgC/YbaW family acyl-CoA thioester hydrolase
LATSSKSSRISEHTLRRRVQFHETDAAGIVHFSRFFLYMEEAEHALWRAAGLTIAKRASNVGFPRVSTSFEFHKALRFEDEFDVTIRIVAIAEKTISYACVLTRPPAVPEPGAASATHETIATGSLTIICVTREPNLPMKARAIPQEFLDHLEVSAR